MTFPTSTQTADHLNASTDDPKQARSELESLIGKTNQIIESPCHGWFQEFILPWIDIDNAYSQYTTGTGADLLGYVHALLLDGGSTTTGAAQISSTPISSTNYMKLVAAGDVMSLDFELMGGSVVGADGQLHVVLTTATGATWTTYGANSEIGFVIDGNDIKSFSNKAGTYKENDVTETFSAGASMRVELIAGTSVKWFKDDTLLYTETDTAYIPTTGNYRFVAHLYNGGVSGGQTRIISQPRIAIERTNY